MPKNKLILLTGAGFTKNYGGLLAEEIWAVIFNNKNIQTNKNLRSILLREFDYESAYRLVLIDAKYSNIERDIISSVIHEAYILQEKSLSNIFLRGGYLDSVIFNQLCKFIGDYIQIIFSLNQDLLFERFMMREINRYVSCDMPGNPSDIGKIISSPAGVFNLDKLPNSISGISLDNQKMTYIKMHGSINWLDSVKGKYAAIIGGDKIRKIEEEPLLNLYYYTFFKESLENIDSIIIFGYGFRDEHINDGLSWFCKEKNGKIYVIDSKSPREFYNNIIRERSAGRIWGNISGYYRIEKIYDLINEKGTTQLYNSLIENISN